jgi:hypothetical protein
LQYYIGKIKITPDFHDDGPSKSIQFCLFVLQNSGVDGVQLAQGKLE